ncbi:MAG: DUF3794 domain-containing protein [Lachnospiraceae bacterium]
MELVTHTIQTNELKCRSNIQATLEDDMNVPDTKPDIEKLVKTQGKIQITDINPSDGKVNIRGNLSFSLLYSSNDDIRPIHNIKGQIPFNEQVNMDSVTATDDVFCHFELEDCQASLINSRKVSIRAILSLDCCQNEQKNITIGTDIISEDAARAGMEESVPPEGLNKKFNTVSYTQLALQKNDIFRISDEAVLPKGKPAIDTLLYYEITPQNVQTRIVEDGIRIIGDMLLFALYTPEIEERRLEYIETEIPFDGVINCNGCSENMIPDIEITVSSREASAKPDEDGENRILDVELILKLQMKFYEDYEMQVLDDAYSTSCDLQLARENINYEKLLMKNQSSVRISDHININNSDNILQICSSSGTIQIDEQEITEDGIQIEGAVTLDILYITDNDDRPLGMTKGVIPFSHLVEIKGISDEDSYELQSDINQINLIMIDKEEVEAKITISICALVFTSKNQDAITGITESPLDLQKFNDMPGLAGFIAGDNDTLWDIAKEYNTTPESIMELNGLTNNQIHKGDRLLLMKIVDGI